MTAHYKPAAYYLVVRASDATPVGTLARGLYHSLAEAPGSIDPYSGLVTEVDGILRIRLRSNGWLGTLEGLEVLTPAGDRLRLQQVARPADASQLDDPDVYRVWRDAACCLCELGSPAYKRLQLMVDAAPFDPCPACHDHFGFAESCATCGGWGFVPEI